MRFEVNVKAILEFCRSASLVFKEIVVRVFMTVVEVILNHQKCHQNTF